MQFKALRTLSREYFRKHELIKALAYRNVKVKEKRLVDYTEKLIFEKVTLPFFKIVQ